jgi:nucleoside-diphosphate-sugar epimerase
MKIFLTGAAGKLGLATAVALKRGGHEVIGADRRVRDDFPDRLHRVDLLDEAAVRETMAGCEAVVHAGNHPNVGAAPTPQMVYRENVAMNVHVFQAAAEGGIRRWVFASSIQVCGGDRHGGERQRPSSLPYLPLDGHLPPNPGNLYALSKVAGEDLLRFYVRRLPDLSAVAVRFPMLVDPSRTVQLRARFAVGRPSGPLDEGFSYLTLSDAAELVLALLERPALGFRVLLPAARGNTLGRPPGEIIREYYAGVPLRVPAEQMESLVDLSEIEREYGWSPRDNRVFDGRSSMAPV